MGRYFRILQNVLLVIDSLSARSLKDVIFDARLRLPPNPHLPISAPTPFLILVRTDFCKAMHPINVYDAAQFRNQPLKICKSMFSANL